MPAGSDHERSVDAPERPREGRRGVSTQRDPSRPDVVQGEPELVAREPMPTAQRQHPRWLDLRDRETGDRAADSRVVPVVAPGAVPEIPGRGSGRGTLGTSGEDCDERSLGAVR